MADIVKFVQTPSYVLMDKCTKEQLLKITEHYETKFSDTRLKESSIKVELKNKLIERDFVIRNGANSRYRCTYRCKAYLLHSLF